MRRRLLLVLGCLLGGAVLAAEPGPDLQVLAEEYRPYSYSTPQGPAGPNARRVMALLERAGLKASIEFQPWARAYALASHRDNTLLFGMQRTPEREKAWLWLAELSAEPNYLYRLAKRQDLGGVTVAELPRHRVSVIRRSATAELLHQWGQPERNLEEVGDMTQNLRKLVAGRVDLIAGQEDSLRSAARELGLSPERFVPALRLHAKASLYLAANPRLDPGLRQRLEQALASLQADGSWERLGR